MSIAEPRPLPAPPVDPETQAFWHAAAAGQLMIGRCTACGELHYPPRAICPVCFGDAELAASRGEGEIYTFSIMRKSPTGPYAIGYVTLDEGIRVLTNFVDCEFDKLAIGLRVRVKFQPTENGPPVPVYAPAD
jgi:uncharacterized OB-fold protein